MIGVGETVRAHSALHCLSASLVLVDVERACGEPVLEAGRSDVRVVAGDEGALLERRPEIARTLVGRHPARVAVGIQHALDELVETEPFGTGQLDRAVHRRADRRDRQCGGDVVGCFGLDQHGRQTNRLAVAARIGDATEELEELRRADDRVRDRPRLDRFLLGELRPEVSALLEPIGADDRQRHVMADTSTSPLRRGRCGSMSGRTRAPPRRPTSARSTRRPRPGRSRALRPDPRR